MQEHPKKISVLSVSFTNLSRWVLGRTLNQPNGSQLWNSGSPSDPYSLVCPSPTFWNMHLLKQVVFHFIYSYLPNFDVHHIISMTYPRVTQNLAGIQLGKNKIMSVALYKSNRSIINGPCSNGYLMHEVFSTGQNIYSNFWWRAMTFQNVRLPYERDSCLCLSTQHDLLTWTMSEPDMVLGPCQQVCCQTGVDWLLIQFLA